MSAAVPVLLFALAGVFVGGAISMARQGAPRLPLALVGLLALLAAAGGVAWLIGEG